MLFAQSHSSKVTTIKSKTHNIKYKILYEIMWYQIYTRPSVERLRRYEIREIAPLRDNQLDQVARRQLD